MLNWRN